jgi:ATP-dependent Clp protease ATP-binding subunit ClpC
MNDRILDLAQQEARRLGHNFFGTEQILVALIVDGANEAASAMKMFGVTAPRLRTVVEKIIGRGSGFVATDIPYTPRMKRVFVKAEAEAAQFGAGSANSAHLLLALLHEGQGVAIRALELLDVPLHELEATLLVGLGMNEQDAKVQARRSRIASLERALAQQKEMLEYIRQREAGKFESEMVAQIEKLEQTLATVRSDLAETE